VRSIGRRRRGRCGATRRACFSERKGDRLIPCWHPCAKRGVPLAEASPTKLALCGLEIDIAIERITKRLQFRAERLNGNGRRHRDAHFHEKQRRAHKRRGFLAGGEVFDVDAELAEEIGDAVDDAGLIHGVGLEFEGEAAGHGGGGGAIGDIEAQTHAGSGEGQRLAEGGRGRGFGLNQEQKRELAAKIDHPRIEDIRTGGVKVACELADDAGAIGADGVEDELGHEDGFSRGRGGLSIQRVVGSH